MISPLTAPTSATGPDADQGRRGGAAAREDRRRGLGADGRDRRRTKWVSILGGFPLPIEIAPFGAAATHGAVELATAEVGCPGPAALRKAPDGKPVVTDGGHWILDAQLLRIPDPPALAARLCRMPGVMEHGLFIGNAQTVICRRFRRGALIERR